MRSSLPLKVDDSDQLTLAGRQLSSRFMVGTGGTANLSLMERIVQDSGANVATVAIRRYDPIRATAIYSALVKLGVHILPNTAGCFTAREAVLTAELAREALETDWVKLEVVADDVTALPNPFEALAAAEQLVRKGFQVLPYISDDPAVASMFEAVGCCAVLPLAAPIGSGLGIRNPHNLAIMVERCTVPVIVDAGIGTASDATIAMELGCAGVMAATAITRSTDPAKMARAMGYAVRAGRLAYLAGRVPRRYIGQASSPTTGLIDLR